LILSNIKLIRPRITGCPFEVFRFITLLRYLLLSFFWRTLSSSLIFINSGVLVGNWDPLDERPENRDFSAIWLIVESFFFLNPFDLMLGDRVFLETFGVSPPRLLASFIRFADCQDVDEVSASVKLSLADDFLFELRSRENLLVGVGGVRVFSGVVLRSSLLAERRLLLGVFLKNLLGLLVAGVILESFESDDFLCDLLELLAGGEGVKTCGVFGITSFSDFYKIKRTQY